MESCLLQIFDYILYNISPPYRGPLIRWLPLILPFSSRPSFLHQIYSNREVEEAMTKIRDVLSDDKRDWELRVAAVRPRSHLSLMIS